MAQKFPIVSFVMMLMAVTVLIGLGIWQLERLTWKNNLQQQLDEAFAQKVINPFTDEQLTGLSEGQIVRGRIDGFVDLAKAILVNGRIQDGHSTMALVAPLTTADNKIVAVEIGCSPTIDLKTIQAMGRRSTIMVGVLRVPKWSFATPPNIPAKGEWWRLDNTEMGAFWSIPDLHKSIVTVENSEESIPGLTACPIEKQLRNDHLSYAFFWFAMAGVLCVIWGLRFLRPYLQSA